MTETEHALETIRTWTWSGFYSSDDVTTMLEDIIEDDADRPGLHEAIEKEFARKRTDEASWPALTDFDRLHAVFYRLHEDGICALHNAGYTLSDGMSEVTEVCAQAPAGHYHAYCFYHGQDVARAVAGDGLMIAFGDLDNRSEESQKVGAAVAAALRAAGFDVDWNDSIESRINLPHLDWKQRSPVEAPDATGEPATEQPRDAQPAKPWWKFW